MNSINLSWKTIETAPKDGTEILAYSDFGEGFGIVIFEDGMWKIKHHKNYYHCDINPVYWTYLPKKPKVIQTYDL